MPDFLGIGAQKSGTTWLYQQLAGHPEVDFPGGKEMHFWDGAGQPDLKAYRACFNANAKDGRRQGEITPAYAILPSDRIKLIRQHFPDTRILFLMRNPVDRAWSSALMALDRAEMTIDEASDQWFIDHFHSAGSRRRGDYATALCTWLESFPAERFLLATYDELTNDPRALLCRVASHIGVSPGHFATASADGLYQRVFEGPGHRLRPTLRTLLERLYAPELARLATLLSERFDWPYSSEGWLLDPNTSTAHGSFGKHD